MGVDDLSEKAREIAARATLKGHVLVDFKIHTAHGLFSNHSAASCVKCRNAVCLECNELMWTRPCPGTFPA